MVWSIDAMNRAMAVTPKIRNRRLGGGSPAGTEAGGAWVISPDVTTVYDTAYRQASIFAWRLVLGALDKAGIFARLQVRR
jgi:hypothetical protein